MKIKDELTVRELSAAIVAIDIAVDDAKKNKSRLIRRNSVMSFLLFWQRKKRNARLQSRLEVMKEFRADLLKAKSAFLLAEGRDCDMRPVTFRQMLRSVNLE